MSFKSVLYDLQKTIENVELTSEKFSALNTDEGRILFIYDLFRNELQNVPFKETGKCSKKSRALRETGNIHFRNNDLWNAVSSYTESLAHAPINSEEFSLALGNRSASLLLLNLVKEAICDIDRVLTLKTSELFRDKMLKRKEKCLESLRNSKFIFYNREDVILPQKNSFLCSASSVVKMIDDDIYGRSLIACDDIKTGETLVVEKPFSSIVVPNHLYTHCSWCFKRSFNLIPCTDCVTNLYCDEECLGKAKKSHKTECKVLESLIFLKATALELLSVKVLTDASEQGQSLDKLLSELSNNGRNNIKQIKYDSHDHINIYKLVSNTKNRSNCDLFEKSFIACLILVILDRCGNFFESYSASEKEHLFFFAGSLVLHYLQSMPCNAHEISEYCDSGYEEIGAGVYATLSLINHSCDPNVVRHCYKDVIVLRSIRPIKKGEQLFDNYGYHYATQNLFERQSSLARQYFFQCQCEGCDKKWPLQHDLPDSVPVFKVGTDIRKYDVLTQLFKKNVQDIFEGNYEIGVIIDLLEYLDFLDEFVERPWKDYNICQEAIKHCFGVQGNTFRLSKDIR